ncbi:hypothetical protein AB0E01_22905 [Nocardia vinacea]|uniref:hypothetical protein n=1 Tax=Nocardia vinacea TaxID=96468 RepID=UPI0033EF8BC2
MNNFEVRMSTWQVGAPVTVVRFRAATPLEADREACRLAKEFEEEFHSCDAAVFGGGQTWLVGELSVHGASFGVHTEATDYVVPEPGSV